VYRHSDGYPESVIRDLAKMKELLDATCTERGPGYTAATFIFLNKLSTAELYLDGGSKRTIHAEEPSDLLEPANMEHLDQPLFLLGHSVENPADGIHGDEEFLYEVEVPEVSNEILKTWTVRVSAHYEFPRWNGATTMAFDQATWQFEGSLSAAQEKFVDNSA